MTPVLVDSNVLLDVVTNDPEWAGWSSAALASIADEAVLVINPIIYAEVSVSYDSIEEMEDGLPFGEYLRDHLPYEAAFLAAKAFVEYKRRGGERTSPMPDFYIGAHASVAGYRVLTRDPRRFRTYFPTVELITPDASGPTDRRPALNGS